MLLRVMGPNIFIPPFLRLCFSPLTPYGGLFAGFQIDSKAKNNDKYPEAYEGLMKEPGMTP